MRLRVKQIKQKLIKSSVKSYSCAGDQHVRDIPESRVICARIKLLIYE